MTMELSFKGNFFQKVSPSEYMQKRILTIQDISCFGKCSLTVALPILSAMGVECTVIPTAVLSAHTGCFPGYTFRDLTGDIEGIADHWKTNNIGLNGIYTGYLGSPEQAEIVCGVIDRFRPTFVFVDPAMADNGTLYAGFDERIVSEMRKLCGVADVIVPNLTEAAFLLGEAYTPEAYGDMGRIREILVRLTGLGAKTAALTGVCHAGQQGCVSYCADTGVFEEYFAEHLPVKTHGTGDVFASSMFGALMNGKSLCDAMKTAVEFTTACIRATMGDATHWYGVRFEECLPVLWRDLQ